MHMKEGSAWQFSRDDVCYPSASKNEGHKWNKRFENTTD